MGFFIVEFKQVMDFMSVLFKLGEHLRRIRFGSGGLGIVSGHYRFCLQGGTKKSSYE